MTREPERTPSKDCPVSGESPASTPRHHLGPNLQQRAASSESGRGPHHLPPSPSLPPLDCLLTARGSRAPSIRTQWEGVSTLVQQCKIILWTRVTCSLRWILRVIVLCALTPILTASHLTTTYCLRTWMCIRWSHQAEFEKTLGIYSYSPFI